MLLFFSLVTSLVALQAQLPPRDQPKPLKGTAMVRGFVVDAHSGAPIPRVLVQLYGNSGQGAAHTDAEGRFEIRELAAGTYSLSATRSAYLPTTYGQQGPNTRGKPIVIQDGEVVEKIRVPMSRGGVISGHVTDEYGHPAADVRVEALQYRYQAGARRLMSMSGVPVRTDDLGGFRLYGLLPGQYYVSAQPVDTVRAEPVAPESAGPVTTYYPNAVDPSAGHRVTVSAGKETGGVNIGLVAGRLARLRGRALMSSGEPFAGSWVNLERHHATGSSGGSVGVVRQDGSFEVTGVPAGQYSLVVRPANTRDDSEGELGRARVTVTGEDIDDIMLIGSRGATVRGVLVTDEGVPVPFKPPQWRIDVRPPPEESGVYTRPAVVNDDYSFELKGVFGRVRIDAGLMITGPTARGPEAQWGVKTVLWRGDDITGRFLEFQPSQVIEGVEIVLSRRWSELTGTVTDVRGQAVPDAWLLVFPADESKWRPESRFMQLTRSTADGTYRAERLLAAEYLVAIVPQLEFGQHEDPEFLRALVDGATRVSILDGERKSLNLRIASP